jgi:TolB-like protein/class 3 adenylate cyclase/lipoprotein NlpI
MHNHRQSNSNICFSGNYSLLFRKIIPYKKYNTMRQLAAIMFTDIVGYSALMSKDESAAMHALSKNREIQKMALDRFHGKFIKEIGDGTLSIFQSSWDAVRCAAFIQSRTQHESDLSLRIGIHIGDVVIADEDIFGDGVNIASRIQALSEPGGIWLSERVFEDIKNKSGIQAECIGEKSLKNIEQPVKIFAIAKECFHPSSLLFMDPEELRSHTKEIDPSYGSQARVASVAVMPFTDLSPQSDQEYFCDGMAEEIINVLAQIEGLQVVARTSAFSFKGMNLDIREMGRKLHVSKVVEGSVRKSGSRLRITVQLINVEDGYHIWSSRFDREMEDVFAIQEEISLIIADKLKVKLIREDKEKILKRYTDNTEAYDLYLKGRFYWYRRYESGFLKGLEFFQQAIAKDPFYAPAYIGVADCYASMGLFSFLLPGDTYSRAKEAVMKALKIVPDMAEAHASLGWIRMYYDWDWIGAANEFLQAIRANPDYSPAHIWYGMLLSIIGRFDESLAEMGKARELDPLEPLTNTMVGWTYYMSRRFNDSIGILTKVTETDLNFPISYWLLVGNYLALQRVDEALDAALKLVQLTGEALFALASLGVAYSTAGRQQETLGVFNRMNEISKHHYPSPISWAIYYLGTGDHDKVLECLEQSYEDRESMMAFLGVTPVFDNVRHKPRFMELLWKMGLQG